MKASHGGARKGAGRKANSGKYGEATRTLRGPVSVLALVLERFGDLKMFWVWVAKELENKKEKRDVGR
jgi:hypothetical protein